MKLSGCTPGRGRGPYAVNPHENCYKPHMCSEITVHWPHFCCWQSRAMFI